VTRPENTVGPGRATARRAKTVGQAIAIAAVVALLGLLVWKVAKGNDGGVAGALAKGDNPVAPAFTLPRIDTTGDLAFASLKGKAVVVNFWASWCLPCKDEAPFLQKTYEKYREQGLVVLGVDAQDFRQDAKRFMRRFGITYPVVYDGEGSTLAKWGVTGFPETFFVDRQGRLVGERIAGGVDIERNRDTFGRGVQLALGGQ
jgi:cytochrome c biogenesis protein CcmG/thiol:disulfide interchange protein DsbE